MSASTRPDGIAKADVLRDFGGAQFSAFKAALVDLAVDQARADRRRDAAAEADPGHIDAVLADGAERASVLARGTMDAVKDIVGLIRR